VAWLQGRGVVVETGCSVTGIERAADGRATAVLCGQRRVPCDVLVVALPWKQTSRLLPDLLPVVDARADETLAGSPITAVHLWFDRPVVDLPHAVLVGRVSQWVFRADPSDAPGRGPPDAPGRGPPDAPGYCQIVISASRGLLGGDRGRLLETVVAELREIFPAAREARLLDSRIVTDPTAVLSVRPGVEAVRPPSRTRVPNLLLAGDWTATGWPSTMEGAVRSGRLAAEAAAERLGRPIRGLVADLPKNLLVRLLAGS